ncbi:vacuolar protein sorting-associated protein 51 homolog [Papaver somniferum]|uniref:vacuolar protein sorting-associated protein 51 homolog n=1 Tax=Papaver somniferum TaxID=3469 RepID=UPI000E6FC24E|nr:vacuolar protein sorting-associated protein 51 homolog [Papaver somniferum]
MAVEDVPPLDDKAKRMRDLLSSFYSPDLSSSSSTMAASAAAAVAKQNSLESINSPSFDPDQYMKLLIHKSNLEGLLQRHVEMAAEIKNLDTDLQMLVYENYNKFISATETIKRMKNNIVGMEVNMEQLLDKIVSVQSKSDVVNTSLFEKREHIEKLHRTRNLLRKVQFIYDLPTRLGKCIKSEAYVDAVKFYTGAMPIFKVYGDSSFQDCKRASEEAMGTIIKNLQAKLMSDSEHIEARTEAVQLLKQLDFPVDSLRTRLLEKLQHFVGDLQLEATAGQTTEVDTEQPIKVGKATVQDFAEAVRAYRVIFPESEEQLTQLARELFSRHSKTIENRIKKKVAPSDILKMLRVIWMDIAVMDEVLPEAALPLYSLEVARDVTRQYVRCAFSHLLQDVSEALMRVHAKPKVGIEEDCLQVALDGSKRVVIQGSMEVLLGFRQLLDDNLEILVKLRDSIVDWVQDGFQQFFKSLDDYFLLISGGSIPTTEDQDSVDATKGEKVLAGLVLVLAQLAVFIEQSAIPRITEEIAASFSGGGVHDNENGPAFVPGEICRTFRAAGEKFLHLYINMKTQKISVLLRKRFTTPNWIKHKEPREVHMFVDLLLQELEAIRNEVKQILPRGHARKHRRSDSNGSTASSRSNPIREDKNVRSNAQRARSQLLETHLAKLFKQKMEIFTKVEYTQESVVSTMVKLCLKSFQEFVRLQSFNRSGFQQIQLDIQFLRTPLKEIAEDEAAIDFLLDEVTVATAERCLDSTPLEPAILDRLIQAKLTRGRDQNNN